MNDKYYIEEKKNDGWFVKSIDGIIGWFPKKEEAEFHRDIRNNTFKDEIKYLKKLGF